MNNPVMNNPVIAHSTFCLAHVPDLVRYGSKPRRVLVSGSKMSAHFQASLRTFDDAVRYPPNQTFIGNLSPSQLGNTARPWHTAVTDSRGMSGPFGEIVQQDVFYALLEQANVLQPPLIALCADQAAQLRAALTEHPVLGCLGSGSQSAPVIPAINATDTDSLELRSGEELRGHVHRDNRAEGREDDNLSAHLMLEALCTKASGAIALQTLLHRSNIEASSIDYLISCGEEAAGDRYQRGGGGLAKAIGEMCGCTNASGMDVKNFCAAPASALITAGALVKAGVYERIAVVAGGSLAKLGMKFEALLGDGMPLLGDCLGCMAFLVTRDDGISPIMHLEAGSIGTARIGASNSDQAIYRQLITEPLQSLGLSMLDIDRYAPELHNAELMEYAGAGDVAHKNYRMIAATAVLSGAIERDAMSAFIERVGMVGFAPPQGHIPSGVPYLGHAMLAMARGEIKRAMFICKASLFLNRLTTLYDGVSFIVEGRGQSTTKESKT